MSQFLTLVPVTPVVTTAPPAVLTFPMPNMDGAAWEGGAICVLCCASLVLLIMYLAGRAKCDAVIRGWMWIWALLLAVSCVAFFAMGGPAYVRKQQAWAEESQSRGYRTVDAPVMVRSDLLA